MHGFRLFQGPLFLLPRVKSSCTYRPLFPLHAHGELRGDIAPLKCPPEIAARGDSPEPSVPRSSASLRLPGAQEQPVTTSIGLRALDVAPLSPPSPLAGCYEVGSNSFSMETRSLPRVYIKVAHHEEEP
ncbi:hypothetical protein NDU88_003214 [Pleurodeles waltl]|uniref:Uncharacterized protein n=1 Tax=Pleurodeles waltl TaxID=8319 RepID=A0AAV7SCT8_PLEWA|nr:hypothetical protein NDU88_003214 [Pleurodeles waltl]